MIPESMDTLLSSRILIVRTIGDGSYKSDLRSVFKQLNLIIIFSHLSTFVFYTPKTVYTILGGVWDVWTNKIIFDFGSFEFKA